jgi:hypothetical protein
MIRCLWLTLFHAFAVASLFAAAGVLFSRHAWLSVQVAFAEEQTRIFDQMREQALATEDPVKVAGYLDCAVNYYPSGSKQDRGSKLDRIVERERASAIRDIIIDLRKKTRQDLGADPKIWIDNYVHR